MKYYVSANAEQTGDGTKEKPFATIQSAAQIAEPGDEVIVAPGMAFEPEQRFENPDGTEIVFDEDYYGIKQNSISAGPFAEIKEFIALTVPVEWTFQSNYLYFSSILR